MKTIMRSPTFTRSCSVLLTVGTALAAACSAPSSGGADTAAGLTQRATAPVVLSGGELPSFGSAKTKAGDVVGFVRKGGEWKQIAIQVDERYRADFCTIYGNKLSQCASSSPIETIFYADT